MTMSAAPDLARVNAWLRDREDLELGTATALSVFPGGASNVTCRVDLAGGTRPAVVLRIQRERGIFEPYDVVREGRVIEALVGTEVPVPAVIASEAGEALGAPFIVLEWVDAPHMGEAGPEASYPAFVAAVVGIHQVHWRAAGLGFLGVPASVHEALLGEVAAIERRRQLFAPDVALLAEAEERLRATAPHDGTLALCQGDINVFNYLFRAGQVVAVVDWEQARISDPRSDVGQLVSLAHLKGAPFGPAAGSPFVQMYSSVAGRELGLLEWFRARWLWELAVIYHGWVAFNGSSPWYTWDDVAQLLERSLAEL